jgi:hypothetical protein
VPGEEEDYDDPLHSGAENFDSQQTADFVELEDYLNPYSNI